MNQEAPIGTIKDIQGYIFSPIRNDFILHSINNIYDQYPEKLIYPHIHWMPMNNGTGMVKWDFSLIYFGTDNKQFIKTEFSMFQETSKKYEHYTAMPDFKVITEEQCSKVSILLMRISRDGMNINDTYNGDSFILSIN